MQIRYLKYSSITKFFFYAILPFSLLTGFLLRENITVPGVTPTLFLSVITLIVLLYYFYDYLCMNGSVDKYFLLSLIVFIFFPIIYLMVFGIGYLYAEYNNSLSIFLSITIIIYMSRHSTVKEFELIKILHVLNVILLFNLILSDFLGVGYPSYQVGSRSIGTKGFLYGGNTASVLSLAALSYYLFHNNLKIKFRLFWVSVSLYATILVKTIASIIGPILIVICLFRKYKYKLMTVLFLVLFLSYVFVDLLNRSIIDMEFNSYRLERIGVVNGSFLDNIKQYAEENRRVRDTIFQLEYQFQNPLTLLTGIGRSGQIEIYNRSSFNFSGMDLFDILLKYGIIGISLITVIFFLPLYKYIRQFGLDNLSSSSGIIILYSVFGGYVFSSIPALIYLSICISVMNIKVKRNKLYASFNGQVQNFSKTTA